PVFHRISTLVLCRLYHFTGGAGDQLQAARMGTLSLVREAGYGDYYFVYGSGGTFSIAGILLRGIFYRGTADQRSCDTCPGYHYAPGTGTGAVAAGFRLARYGSNPQHAG